MGVSVYTLTSAHRHADTDLDPVLLIRVPQCHPSSPTLSAVNNAGVGLLGPVESISLDRMKMVFETNFFGTIRMIKEVMPDMKRRRAGHIIVMSSVMGMQGNVGDVQVLLKLSIFIPI